MQCSRCNSSRIRKKGTRRGRQRYFCVDCGKNFSGKRGDIPASTQLKDMSEAKILVYDIETSPLVVYTWSLDPRYISPKNIIHDRFIISWAAKWLGENEILSDVTTPKEAKNRDDRRIVESFWKLLNDADIVIAHNGDRFDMKHLNSKFLEHDMMPPMPFRSIDTLKATRRIFGFTSNALDYLVSKFSLGKKLDTNFQLWVDCVSGVADSLLTMVTYNRHDVLILEDWYMKIRKWIPNHPNIGMYSSDKSEISCPVCGGSIAISDRLATTSASSWKTFRCDGCSKTGRTKLNAMTKDEKRFFIIR